MIRPSAPYRTIISRTVIGCILLFLLWRGFSGILPNQLLQPPLANRNYDLTQWAYKLSGLAELTVQQQKAANWFVGLTIGLGILAFVFPRQRRFIWPFTLLFFLLALAFNVYLNHNSHYLAGAVWLCFCAWPRRDENFEILWDGARYYTCFVYGAAFLWKLWGGAFFQWDNGLLVAKANLAGYLLLNPDTAMAQVYYWCLDNAWMINLGHKLITVAEGLLLAGFFTKKYDRWLIGLLILIQLGTYFFADVFFFELLILALPLLPLSFWKKLWLRTVPKAVQALEPAVERNKD